MATKAGTVELIARELGQALAPLEERLAGGGAAELLAAIGIRLPPSTAANTQVVGAIGGAVTRAAALAPKVTQLVAAIEADDEVAIVTSGAQVVAEAGRVIESFLALSTALESAALALPDPAERASLQALLPGLHRRLFDLVVIEYLEERSADAVHWLTFLGIIERDHVAAPTGNGMQPPFRRRTLRLDLLGTLLSDPAGYLRATYGFGSPVFDARKLFARIHDFLDEFDFPVALIEPPGVPPILEAFLLALEPSLATSPPSLGMRFRFGATEDFIRRHDLHPPWSLQLDAKARFEAGLEGVVRPPFSVRFTPPGGTASIDFGATFVGDDGGRPIVLLGEAGGTRLEATKLSARLGLNTRADGGSASGEPVVRVEVRGGRLVIDMSEGDGFIASILSGVRVESTFELAAQWTPSDGIRFEGGAGIELVLPTRLNLGPVELQNLYFLLGFATDPPIKLGLAAAIGVQIGPFGMSVDRIGVDIPMRFPAERNGNLGAVDLGFRFRPPTGIGVVVDAGPISGGGFLAIDEANGRYAGILQLEAALVSVTAIALLDTRLPGGASGFSFLILVSVELPPIQLGFGFTLNGVGGLAGIHRTVAVDVLRQGVRTGALNHIMFPRDPIRNAPQIIADIRSIFPPAKNRFVFGPFLKLGWGTPSLITGSLGIVLELPDPVRILILGQLKVTVPVPDLPLVSLNLDVLGVIDFGERMLSIDASLYDSRVTIYSVYGDMALRLSWGERPVFALAIGGLNPHFHPPPGFPALRRCTIEIGLGNNPRLSCQSYFALTSNSVQFGALVEAYAAAAGFNIRGWIAFDAIVIFVPFSFRVDISAGVTLRRGSRVIAGIHLSGTLQGPNPWRAKGRACISVFLFDVCVPISLTIGREQGQPVPVVNAWDRLRAALLEVANWQSRIPPGTRRTLGYAIPSGSTLTLIDPAGALAVQQKVLPLNKPLDKLGEARIEGAQRFDVSHVRIGSTQASHARQRDFFAAGQYQNLSEAEKLSRDSYELMDAGVSIESDAVTTGDIRAKPLLYETIVIDAPEPGTMIPFRDFDVRRLGTTPLTALDFSKMAERAAVDLAPRLGLDRYAPTLAEGSRLRRGEEEYVIASTDTLEVRDGLATSMTRGDALDALRDLVAAHPAEKQRWQVIARHEVEVEG